MARAPFVFKLYLSYNMKCGIASLARVIAVAMAEVLRPMGGAA